MLVRRAQTEMEGGADRDVSLKFPHLTYSARWLYKYIR